MELVRCIDAQYAARRDSMKDEILERDKVRYVKRVNKFAADRMAKIALIIRETAERFQKMDIERSGMLTAADYRELAYMLRQIGYRSMMLSDYLMDESHCSLLSDN